MGIDIIVCFDCGAPTLLDIAGTAASIYALVVLLLAAATAIPRLREPAEDLQLLASTSSMPILVAILAGVVAEFPEYTAVAIAAAAVAMPVGILAAGSLEPNGLPDGALCLSPGPRPRPQSALGRERLGTGRLTQSEPVWKLIG